MAEPTPTPEHPRDLSVLQRLAPQPVSFDDASVELMPSIGWVVHEIARSTDTAPLVWAWCKVGVDKPGYEEITFTLSDGRTPADPGDGRLFLGPVLFKVWC